MINELFEKGGFVTDKDLPEVVKENPFQKILVRCGNGRFTCHAQDAAHFIAIIDASEADYVRDVSVVRS